MATIALLTWPLIALVLFRNLSAISGLVWGTTIPYLFLPEKFAIQLPGVPDLEKTSVIALGVFLGFVTNRQKFINELSRNPVSLTNNKVRLILLTCVWLFFGGIIVTVLSNGDPLRYGRTGLPAMRPWDAVSFAGDALFFLLPFFFARTYLARPEAHRKLLTAFVIMGVVYSFLMLIEIRLSPQLHNWIYGYHQHSFNQHVRDGFRPKVFLFHGLWVGFFMFMATIAAFCMWRTTEQTKWLWVALWIFLVLALSRNLAAFLLAILALIALFALTQRIQIIFALVIASTVLLYPVLRQAQLIPINQIMGAAATISEDRAASLLFRLENEDQLLAKAFERPLAGWGGYSRERVYNEAGRDISISEGRWIQTISTRGWIGYISLFGLLTVPVLFLMYTRRRKPIPPETIGLMLIIVGNLIYMVPNSTLTVLGWLVFGALAGFVQYDSTETTQTTPRAKATNGRIAKNRYSRFGPKSSPS